MINKQQLVYLYKKGYISIIQINEKSVTSKKTLSSFENLCHQKISQSEKEAESQKHRKRKFLKRALKYRHNSIYRQPRYTIKKKEEWRKKEKLEN